MLQRLALENFIFWQAARQNCRIIACGGRLICPSYEPYLQVSVYLYNTCFATLLDDDMSCLAQGEQIAGGVKNGWLLAPKAKK